VSEPSKTIIERIPCSLNVLDVVKNDLEAGKNIYHFIPNAQKRIIIALILWIAKPFNNKLIIGADLR